MSARAAMRLLGLTAVGAMVLATGWGQGRPGGGGGTTTAPPASGSTGTPSGRGTTNIPSTPNPTNNPPTMRPPILLSGRVLLEDGTPPPEPAKIERICNGVSRAEGYADSKGYFSIQIGNEGAVFQDASEQGGGANFPGGGMGNLGGMSGQTGSSNNGSYMSDSRLNNCELRADVSGYRSQLVNLMNRHALDNPDIGVILLHRQAPNEGSIISARSLAAPKDARKAFDKGQDHLKKKKLDDAFKEFQKAVMLYPAYSTAWCELGKIEAARGQADIARGSFNEAIKADPKFVEPYLHLSRLALADKNWQQLADLSDKALELDNFDYPQEFLFNAVAHYNLHDLDGAQKSVLRAEKLDTRHLIPDIAHLEGLVLAQRGDYTAAAEHLRTYLTQAPDAPDAATVRQQLADIEKAAAQVAEARRQEQPPQQQ
jgi:tetratricopeptide (TPR) repeat protein